MSQVIYFERELRYYSIVIAAWRRKPNCNQSIKDTNNKTDKKKVSNEICFEKNCVQYYSGAIAA